MDHEEWLERAEVYALGALDGEDLKRFEAHLAACSLCERQVRESREALVQLPRSLAPIEPPTRIKADLLRRIGTEAKVAGRKKFAFRAPSWGISAGALAAATLIIVLGWNLLATRQELEKTQSELAALKKDVTQREEVFRLLSDPQIRIVNLAALPAGRGARGQLLWNASSRTGMLLVSGLPPSPTGKAYELWGIAGTEPVPAGVFIVDAGGLAQVRLPKLPGDKKFDKFAVTIEPAAGVSQPTGPMVLLGSL